MYDKRSNRELSKKRKKDGLIMDKFKKKVFTLYKDYGFEVMRYMKVYRKTHHYDMIQMATICYEYYRIILEIIKYGEDK